tara:strand:- start:175 stop:375 length:201 start_codon:yes stop_codon:yes gene_type:complete
MVQRVKEFCSNEDGAVTVDWVVLTAAIILITIAAYLSIQNGSDAMASSVGNFLTETPIEDLRNGLD